MRDSLVLAKEHMHQGEYSCVIAKKDTIYTSKFRGVRPILELIDKNIDLTGFVISDKVVGKAAAILFVYAKIEAVYTPIISESAAEILHKHSVELYFDKQVSHIINRDGTDICPLEKATMNIDDIHQGYEIIRKTIQKLMSNK